MNHGPLVFLGVLFSLAVSWLGLIVTPQLQFGRQEQVLIEPANYPYPVSRSGAAQQGAEVYRANGCFYCHTQQVRQSGVQFDVVVVSAGTNAPQLVREIRRVQPPFSDEQAAQLLTQLPKPVAQGLSQEQADAMAKELSVPDAKIEVVLVPTGPEIERGWGKRTTVAQDYLLDRVVMLGRARVGPDLASIGTRQTNDTWHLLHLYDPQLTAPGSTMPSYRYLFAKRKVIHHASADALKLPANAVEAGYEIVPKPQAVALVAYLNSLQADAPLFEAPIFNPPKPPAAEPTTNQPPINAGTTNPPAGSPKP